MINEALHQQLNLNNTLQNTPWFTFFGVSLFNLTEQIKAIVVHSQYMVIKYLDFINCHNLIISKQTIYDLVNFIKLMKFHVIVMYEIHSEQLEQSF